MARTLTVLATAALVLTIVLVVASYTTPIAFTFYQDGFGRFMGVRLDGGWGTLYAERVIQTATPRTLGPAKHNFFLLKLYQCVYPRDFVIRRTTNETSRQMEVYQTGDPGLSSQQEFQLRILSVHCIVPLLLTTMLVYLVLRGPMRRRRFARNNQCLKCGYSLRGNTSGTCSECGTRSMSRS